MMNKRLLFTLFALTITACGTSTSTKKSLESPQLQDPIAETTPVSRIVPEVTPSSSPTFKVVPELNSTIKSIPEPTKPIETATSQAVPEVNQIVKSTDKPANSTQKITQAAKSTYKPTNSTQNITQAAKSTDKPTNSTQNITQAAKSTDKPTNSTQNITQAAKSTDKPTNSTQKITQAAKSTNNRQKPVSIPKLVANISSKIGCGKVNQQYKIRVATIAIANYNPQSFEGLSRKQIRQAVKKSIANYPERAEGLVEEYRNQYCTDAKNTPPAKSTVVDSKQQVSVSNAKVIPRQSGSCKQLRARGFKDIDVAVNPWAKGKDRDDDGIACESK